MSGQWEFWIDVGGTFTDCISKTPSGQLTTAKVLSSGITKGQVAEVLGRDRFSDSTRLGDPADFWSGYTVRFLDDFGQVIHSARVRSSQSDSGIVAIEQMLPDNVVEGTRYELTGGEEAPLVAIRRILGLKLKDEIPPITVKLGTTRGTNALLTRRGARVAFVTTKGFADVLLIGNQDRPRLFDLAIKKPEPLFERVIEIDERLDASGAVLKAPDLAAAREQFIAAKAAGIQSIGICLLHAFANGEHERQIEQLAREVGFVEVSTSSRLSPLIKIVSRGDTTVADAYLNPILRQYVGSLQGGLSVNRAPDVGAADERDPAAAKLEAFRAFLAAHDQRLTYERETIVRELAAGADPNEPDALIEKLKDRTGGRRISRSTIYRTCAVWTEFLNARSQAPAVLQAPLGVQAAKTTLKLMTSSGGLVDATNFVGKDSILSGPAGGVIGFSRVAQQAGFEKSIGFDMGGTSTDVSRFDGRYEYEFETMKAGVRIVAPMLSIETVAAGGGSVCGFDGVKLFVGPQSAGADPGPACYGRGGPLTITDVNLYLGRVLPSYFPFPLDVTAVERRLTKLCEEIAASPLGKKYSPVELADGFRQIANANMVRAIRKISVAKGYDPADYVLMSFGGAGSQHACALAEQLGMSRILVHPYSGLLSAYGIGLADVRRFAQRSVLRPLSKTNGTSGTLGTDADSSLVRVFEELQSEALEAVRAEGIPDERIAAPVRSLDLRYKGVEATINVPEPADGDFARAYHERHQQLYGYVHTSRPLEVVAARVEVVGKMAEPVDEVQTPVAPRLQPRERVRAWFGDKFLDVPVFHRDQLHAGDEMLGPAILCEPTSTVVIERGWYAVIRGHGEIVLFDNREDDATHLDPAVRRALAFLDEETESTSNESLQPLGFVDESDIQFDQVDLSNLPTCDFSQQTISSAIRSELPEGVARENKVVPVRYDDGTLVIAVTLSISPEVIDKVRFILNQDILFEVASADAIETAIKSLYGNREQPDASNVGASGLPLNESADPVLLEIFNNLFASIAEQMGVTLQKTSVSTNVKERLDFSCAIFTPTGDLVVNAPHIPVHLGAMSETVKCLLRDVPVMAPGDVYVTNDPFRGGSHLPDVTVISPVHEPSTGELLFLTASRAHHAEIGGIVPGSMPPFSKNLAEEGVLIRCFRLVEGVTRRREDAKDQTLLRDSAPSREVQTVSHEDELRELLTTAPLPTRNVQDNLSDIAAEVAANNTGVKQLLDLVDRYSLPVVQAYMRHIQRAACEKMRRALAAMPDGEYSFTDHLDDGSPIQATITIKGDSATVDFTGTGPVLRTSNLNANRAITTAATLYVFRCLINEDIPLNSGVLEPVEIILPECLLNPPSAPDARDCVAIVGGNVETSQRVVDVLLGALKLAAASQGTMNNLTFGDGTFGYYETICGGSGATRDCDGANAVHTHMTNTRLTDAEVIERRYSVRVHEFSIRKGSGGAGQHRGGDGIVRRIEFLKPLKVSLLTERRGPYAPFGLEGGSPGACGQNTLTRAATGITEDLPGKVQLEVAAGDVLTIKTPGAGGWGASL